LVAAVPPLCFDTNALIFLVDRVSPYYEWLNPLFLSIQSGERDALFSVITEAEVRVRPLREGLDEKLDRLAAFFAGSSVRVIEASREIAWVAAEVRAETSLALPDAIIVATAIVTECDALIGNDHDCARRVKAIPYVYLDEAVTSGRSP